MNTRELSRFKVSSVCICLQTLPDYFSAQPGRLLFLELMFSKKHRAAGFFFFYLYCALPSQSFAVKHTASQHEKARPSGTLTRVTEDILTCGGKQGIEPSTPPSSAAAL